MILWPRVNHLISQALEFVIRVIVHAYHHSSHASNKYYLVPLFSFIRISIFKQATSNTLKTLDTDIHLVRTHRKDRHRQIQRQIDAQPGVQQVFTLLSCKAVTVTVHCWTRMG